MRRISVLCRGNGEGSFLRGARRVVQAHGLPENLQHVWYLMLGRGHSEREGGRETERFFQNPKAPLPLSRAPGAQETEKRSIQHSVPSPGIRGLERQDQPLPAPSTWTSPFHLGQRAGGSQGQEEAGASTLNRQG